MLGACKKTVISLSGYTQYFFSSPIPSSSLFDAL